MIQSILILGTVCSKLLEIHMTITSLFLMFPQTESRHAFSINCGRFLNFCQIPARRRQRHPSSVWYGQTPPDQFQEKNIGQQFAILRWWHGSLIYLAHWYFTYITKLHMQLSTCLSNFIQIRCSALSRCVGRKGISGGHKMPKLNGNKKTIKNLRTGPMDVQSPPYWTLTGQWSTITEHTWLEKGS